MVAEEVAWATLRARRVRSRLRRTVRDVAIRTGARAAQHEWKIATYWTDDPLDTDRLPAIANFDRTKLDWCTADFVADPFVHSYEGGYYLFYEALNRRTSKGEIGVARSPDGEHWEDVGPALVTEYHLSYPQVWAAGDDIFMLPECHESGKVVLYAADEFPTRWRPVATLLEGRYADSTLFEHEGIWWIYAFGGDETRDLHLFSAPRIEGPWVAHPKSPVRLSGEGMTRPGGRVIRLDGRLLRFAQSAQNTYGEALHCLHVEELSSDRYSESILRSPLLQPSSVPWAGHAMHHLEAIHGGEGKWLVAIDGQVGPSPSS